MKDKATFQNKAKVLNKIPNITIPDMCVIMELQKNTKSGKLF